MDLALLSILALGILIVCIVSYPDKFVPKSIENMNTEEIITDFELLIQTPFGTSNEAALISP